MPPDLKPGWTRVAFGDVVRLNTDRCADPTAAGIERYVGLEHIEPGDLRIRTWGSVAEGTTFTNLFRPGQVLFGKRRAYLRKVAVADFTGVCSGDIYVFEPRDPAVLLPELLPFLCQTDAFFDHAVGTSAGSLSPRTHWSRLATYEFALPPLPEQRRIAGGLQEVLDCLESIRTVSMAIEVLHTSLVEHVIRTADHEVSLDTVLTSISYGCSYKSSYEDSGTPILRIPNVLRGQLDLTDLQRLKLGKDELERYRVQQGDILIVRTNGNPDYVGRCVVAPALETPTVFASYLIRLRIDTSRALPEYLVPVLSAPSFRKRLRGDVRSSAGNYNINTVGIRRQRLPIPTLDDQKSIVEQFSQFDEAKSKIDLRRETTLKLNKAIMASLESVRYFA